MCYTVADSRPNYFEHISFLLEKFSLELKGTSLVEYVKSSNKDDIPLFLRTRCTI